MAVLDDSGTWWPEPDEPAKAPAHYDPFLPGMDEVNEGVMNLLASHEAFNWYLECRPYEVFRDKLEVGQVLRLRAIDAWLDFIDKGAWGVQYPELK